MGLGMRMGLGDGLENGFGMERKLCVDLRMELWIMHGCGDGASAWAWVCRPGCVLL